jgi:WhiB family redox-sensing transcriptional regulator
VSSDQFVHYVDLMAPGDGTMSFLRMVEAGRPAWQHAGACHQHPEVDFFPERASRRRQRKATAAAKSVCGSCVVREDCLAFAMADIATKGIWGGQSERGRQQLRSARRHSA